MKKLLLFATLFLAMTANAQTVEEETTALNDLISVAKSKTEVNEKAQAVVNIMVFGAKSKNEETKKSADAAVAELNNYKIIDKLVAQSGVVFSKAISVLSKEDLKNFRVEEDKFRNITFLTPKIYGTTKSAYLGIKEDVLKFHLVMEYNGSGWIFWNKAIFLYNGKTFEFTDENVKRDVSSGANVSERSDYVADTDMITALREMVNTEKVDVRFSGEKVHDFEMSKQTKKSIALALELYDKLKK